MSDEVILVRHAETELAKRFCGHLDPPLNARGIAQLPALVNQLAGWSCKCLYSSDLLRAQQTAAAIAEMDLSPILLRMGLREIFFGAWEGLAWNEIEAQDREEAIRWMEEYPQRSAPDGEAYKSFVSRVKAEADFLFEQAKGGRVLAVTHAGVIQTILSLRSDISSQQAWQWTKDYGAIIVITQQGRIAYSSTELSHG
jgi:alpha-ribazole phosphatase